MQDLPRDIDTDAVIEIGRSLDDMTDNTPVDVQRLALEIRKVTQTKLPDRMLENLIVEMASTRGLPMLLDKSSV